MLKASEGVESYTDATPLRLLPCEGACQKAKASTCPSCLLRSISSLGCWLCLFMLVPLLKPALVPVLVTRTLQTRVASYSFVLATMTDSVAPGTLSALEAHTSTICC